MVGAVIRKRGGRRINGQTDYELLPDSSSLPMVLNLIFIVYNSASDPSPPRHSHPQPPIPQVVKQISCPPPKPTTKYFHSKTPNPHFQGLWAGGRVYYRPFYYLCPGSCFIAYPERLRDAPFEALATLTTVKWCQFALRNFFQEKR